jgi:DNA-binding LacI/PurR family transcriptional regulator
MPQKANTTAAASLSVGRDSGSLLASLRDEILSGKVAIGDFLPTVRKLSDERGVAHGTAWRALKALEAEGLVEARPRHGYRVLGTATTAASRGTVAYVLDQRNLSISWGRIYNRLLAAAESCAAAEGLDLLKMILAPGQEAPVLRQLERAELGGLILDWLNEPVLEWAHTHGVPTVLIDDWRPGLDFDVVLQGNSHGGELAVRHLLELDCREIAWFGQVGNHHGRARYGGACGAMAAEGLRFCSEYQLSMTPEQVARAAHRLLSEKSRPQGVVALQTNAAQALMAEARAMGLKPGKDFHAVGWCCAELYSTSYTTMFDGAPPPAVVWSAEEMIATALSRLKARSANHKLPATCTALQVSIRKGE